MIEETVGKYHVEYNEENHSYYVNGQKAISVTTLIKWANPLKYSGIDEEILKKAAEYGTKVHEAIENYETIGMADKEVEELSDYLFLKKHYKWEVKECEKIIVIPYKDIYIAGRLDMIMELNGTIGIVDIKLFAKMFVERIFYTQESFLYKIWRDPKKNILNIKELSSLIHFPHGRFNQNPRLARQKFKIVPAPDDLPRD